VTHDSGGERGIDDLDVMPEADAHFFLRNRLQARGILHLVGVP
jgi:hypothetical protein